MRLVLDSNIVLSALLWRGAPYRLLEAVRLDSRITLYSSPTLLQELADVLIRPSPSRRLTLIGKTARDVLADYIEVVELVEPASVPRVIAADPDDDHVIAAAVTAGADWIVSGDKQHLLALGSHAGIAIVDAATAVERITAQRSPVLPPAFAPHRPR